MGKLRIWAANWRKALLGVIVLGAAAPWALAQPTIRQTIHPVAAKAPASTSPMDEPLRLVHQAKHAYQQIHDYSCIMVKREKLQGQLQPENIIAMKLRNQPFSVHLKWLSPKTLEGQEACYVAGKNNGMLRVKPTGLLGAVGFVTLDPKDPRVTDNSRHSITDAGIGNMIERLSKGWELDRQQGNQPLVNVADYEFAKRPCTRVELCRHNSKPGQFYSYRFIIFFDKQTHLPVRLEAYDWPKQGGDPKGELIECYSYVNLKFNTGLSDQDFNK